MYDFYTIHKICKNMTSLIFDASINSDNVQGSCGILSLSKNINNPVESSSKSDARELLLKNTTDKVFYKYGNNGYNCTLSRQEFVIAQNLMEKCGHFPNFMRSIVYLKNHIVRNEGKDPFSILNCEKKKLSCVDVSIFEYLEKVTAFHEILNNTSISTEIINTIVMQIFMAITAGQQNAKFTHNDLHASNILLIKCSKNIKILYRIMVNSKERLFLVPTHGYIPIIIDYGFSFSEECNGMSLECIDSDNYGLITYKFDSLTDFIRLFVVLYGSQYNEDLSKYIRTLFRKLPISMKSSWEDIVKHESSYYIEKRFSEIYSKIFSVNSGNKQSKYLHYQILRLLMRNIILPINYNKNFEKYSFLDESANFLNMWIHIEKWFKYDYEKIFILRELLDNIRRICNFETCSISIDKITLISKGFYESIGFICNKKFPVDIKWDKFITTINKLVGSIQNILAKNIHYLDKKRKHYLYEKLHSGEEMFEGILKFIYNDDKIKLEINDEVFLIDNIKKMNMSATMEESGDFSVEEIYSIFS